MNLRLSRRRLGVLAAGALATPLAAPRIVRAADPFKLRCSLDTAPSHMRNVNMADYLQKLEKASGGRIKTELFSAGSLFSDANVSKALVQGQVEMACPGTWVLTGFVPDCDVINLPVLYGQPVEVCRKALDGKTGAYINGELQKKLRVRVLGPWLHLGFQNWYSATRPLKSFADLKGMKIRNAGGGALAWRTRWFDAIPNTTPWPDVPLALSQGTFDGLITTNESSFSAKLWEAGMKSSIQDHQNVNNYVPLVSDRFISSLPSDLQKLVVDTWTQNIQAYRTKMLDSQVKALEELKSHGVQDFTPSAEEIASIRKKMMSDQDKLVKELRMSPQVPKLLEEDIGGA